MDKRFILAGALMIFAVGLVACDKSNLTESAGKKADQAAEKIESATEKAGEAIDDAAITTKVKAAVLAEPGLKVLQISVDTTKGVVTLSGSVDSQLNSDRAKEIAGAVAGVKEVENRLVVKATN